VRPGARRARRWPRQELRGRCRYRRRPPARLLPDWQPLGPFGQTAWALWPQQTRLPLKTRVFVDFLGARLAQTPAAVDGKKVPKSAS